MYKKNTNLLNIYKKTLQDYYSFFTTEEGADVLPYVYLENPKAFDNLVKNCKDYYLFWDEVELVNKNKLIISDYLAGVENVLEIGPGSDHSVSHKTLSILKYANNLKNYYPIDICTSYLTGACNLVKQNNHELNVIPLKADMMKLSEIKLSDRIEGKKALMILGSTLCGQTDEEQNKILQEIYNSLGDNDIFIITTDTTNDEKLLLDAYKNKYLQFLTQGSLKYFVNFSEDFQGKLDAFTMSCSWNKDFQYIDLFYTLKTELTFDYPEFGKINLRAGQELRGIKSRKPSTEQFVKKLNAQFFVVNEIVTNSDKMQMFICHKDKKIEFDIKTR
jgi:uncharacterized SAM-dependent methyltransferase